MSAAERAEWPKVEPALKRFRAEVAKYARGEDKQPYRDAFMRLIKKLERIEAGARSGYMLFDVDFTAARAALREARDQAEAHEQKARDEQIEKLRAEELAERRKRSLNTPR